MMMPMTMTLIRCLVHTSHPTQEFGSAVLCRHCGTIHATHTEQCEGCGKQVPLMEFFATRQRQEQPWKLISCVGCSAIGRVQLGRYREPARPVKASTVSDVHVLAQSMIHRAERKRVSGLLR